MAPVVVDPKRVHAFADRDAFHAWLGRHHDSEPEVWIRIYKVRSGEASITPAEAIDAVPEAKAMFETLSRQNRFSLIFRTESMKTEAGRQKKIAALVDMLARGETIHPQGKAS